MKKVLGILALCCTLTLAGCGTVNAAERTTYKVDKDPYAMDYAMDYAKDYLMELYPEFKDKPNNEYAIKIVNVSCGIDSDVMHVEYFVASEVIPEKEEKYKSEYGKIDEWFYCDFEFNYYYRLESVNITLENIDPEMRDWYRNNL